MSERVDSDKIENIVGVERRPVEHWARAVSSEQTVYILHSQACFDSRPDLDCHYTLALDNGIDLDAWDGFEDKPVRVTVSFGRLIPYGVSDGGEDRPPF